MLIAGIAIGLIPLKRWQPPESQVLVSLQIVEIPHDALSGMGVDPGKLSDGVSVIRDMHFLESRLPHQDALE
jgi:hypothetical protein